MNRISSYGPALIVLVTTVLVLFLGPQAVHQLTFAHTEARIIPASKRLAGDNVLEQINQATRDVAAVVEPSVVHVSVERRDRDTWDRPIPGSSSGSGWIYDDLGHVVTNNHVIEDAARIDVQLSTGVLRPAEVVGFDELTDIAVLRIAPDRLHPAPRGDLDEPIRQGDTVFAFGSPFEFRFSMSSGVVSGVGRSAGVIRSASGSRGYENFIQVDAAINPGNSGGPLTNVRGEVIGMNTAIATGPRATNDEGQFAGIGLAIPIQMIVPVVDQLITTGTIDRGFLGIEGQDLDTLKAASRYHADSAGRLRRVREQGFGGSGVLVLGVRERSAARQAGIFPDDVIVAVDGEPIAKMSQLRSVISSNRPGETVTLTVWRYDADGRTGSTFDVEVLLRRLDEIRMTGRVQRGQRYSDLAAVGIELMTDATPEAARELNVEYREGVLIRRLVPGMPLGRLVPAGSIIVAVNDWPVRDRDEFIDRLAEHNLLDDRGVPATIVRPDGSQITLPLKVSR